MEKLLAAIDAALNVGPCNTDEELQAALTKALLNLAAAVREFRAMKHVDALAGWELVGPGTPLNAWLETKKAGEAGTNCCAARIAAIGADVEWVERETGRTTLTHHSFAPPDYWRWPVTTKNLPAMSGLSEYDAGAHS